MMSNNNSEVSSGHPIDISLKKANFTREVIPLTDEEIAQEVKKKIRYSQRIMIKDTALYRSNPELFAPGGPYGPRIEDEEKQ